MSICFVILNARAIRRVLNQVCGVPTSRDIYNIILSLHQTTFMFLVFDHLSEININYKHSEIQKFKFWMVLLPRAWTLAYASNENVSYKCFKTILCWTLFIQNHILAGTIANSLDPGLYKYWELLNKSKQIVYLKVHIYISGIHGN